MRFLTGPEDSESAERNISEKQNPKRDGLCFRKISCFSNAPHGVPEQLSRAMLSQSSVFVCFQFHCFLLVHETTYYLELTPSLPLSIYVVLT